MGALEGAGDIASSIVSWVSDAFSGFGQMIMDGIGIGANFFSDLFSNSRIDE